MLEGFPEIVGPLFELLQRHPALDKCIVLVDLRCSTRMYPDWRLRGVHNETGQLPVMVPTQGCSLWECLEVLQCLHICRDVYVCMYGHTCPFVSK